MLFVREQHDTASWPIREPTMTTKHDQLTNVFYGIFQIPEAREKPQGTIKLSDSVLLKMDRNYLGTKINGVLLETE